MATIAIETLDDPRVALYRDVRDRELRGEHGRFVAESLKVVERLLASRFVPESFFLEKANLDRLGDRLDARLAALDATVPVFVAEPDVLRGIAGYHVHRGALAIVPRPDRQSLSWRRVIEPLLERRTWTVLAANGVTHMDNIGALFRCGAAMEVDAIVLDDRCCDPLLRKPIRVAMGHSLHLPFGWCDDLAAPLGEMKRAEQSAAVVIGLEAADHPSLSGRDGVPPVRPLWELPPVARMVIVVGSEGHGLDASTVALCDAIHEIPMSPGVPSLNLANAAAIALYERLRVRTEPA